MPLNLTNPTKYQQKLHNRMKNYLEWEKQEYRDDPEGQSPEEFEESQKRKYEYFLENPEEFTDFLDDTWDDISMM